VVIPTGPGLYTVEVASRAQNAEGAYTLSVQPQRPSRDLRLDELVADSLGGADAYRNDDRFETSFTVSLEEGARAQVNLQAQGFTPRLQVTGPGGAITIETGGTAEARTYRFTAPGTGRHTIVLSANEPGRGGPYRLRVLAETPPRVRALSVGEALTGTLERGDTHRFRFDGVSGQRLILAVAAQGLTPRMALQDPGGSRVASGAEALTSTLTSTGAYTVELTGADSTGGSYSITARVVATAEQEGGAIQSEIRREPPGRELPSETGRPVGGATYVVDGTRRRVQAALLPENPGVEATGTYRLSIASDGRVTEAEIVRRSGNPVLDADALRALVRWRFEGGSQPETATVTIRFSVRD
jgi:TonB family protein